MSPTPSSGLDQLKRALENGHIDQATFDAATAAMNAQLTGAGAIAQGQDAQAVGAGGVGIGGDNHGDIKLIIQQGSRPGASRDDLRRAYLARVLTRANHLPLFAGDSGHAQIRLVSVYTALLTQRAEADPATPTGAPEHKTRKLSALDVLDEEGTLVLLGDPGGGKSTFVNFVALAMAGELLGLAGPNLATLTAPLPQEEDQDEEPQPQQWRHGALLPVQITLRDLASQLPPAGAAVNAETVWRYLETQLHQAALADYAPHLREEMLGQGALVLFDGLDEVPDALNRRGQIKQAVQDFAATFSRCRFLVTSRTYAYQNQQWKLDAFAETQLQPFGLGQMHRFVAAWYGHMVELMRLTQASADDRAEVLRRAIATNPRLRDLAERPLLLTLIAQVQTEAGGTLPEKREELYDKAVEMLLNQWENMKVRQRADGGHEAEPSLAEWLKASRDDIRKALNRLAFEAHRDQPRLTGTADIRQDSLLTALLGASAQRADVQVLRLEEYLRDRAGILAAHGNGLYQFPHRTFQEYLAACHLTDDDFPDKLADLARADPDRWREVVLLAGAKAARGSALNAWALCEALCLAPPTTQADAADHWGALLAGRVLVESADLVQVAPRNVAKRERVRDWQLAILRGGVLPASERALAGRSLAVLGDPRPEVMTLDGMQFCFMPPGPFVMGNWNEQHRVDVNYPCFIARYPVSVAQWREYVERSGATLDDERSLRGRVNEPVRYVTWHEALRCCDYLTQVWRHQLPAGWIVTLPSEAEWEKAARGGEVIPAKPDCLTLPQLGERLAADCALATNPLRGRAYPWGDDYDENRANIERSLVEINALGAYPAGASPYGCEEMSGNVWEWSRSLWGRDWNKPEFVYPYQVDDPKREDVEAGNDVMRVVRGGAWLHPRSFARCAFRAGTLPDSRSDYLGFWVVLCSAPVRRL